MPFKPGQSGNKAGRPPGPNKLTADIKAMIEGALKDAGGQKYLAEQAKANPTAFMGLIGRLVPKDSNVNVTGEMSIRAWMNSLGEPD